MRANSACHCVRVSILVFLCVPTWPLGGASKNPIQTVAKAVKSATKAELQSAYSALTEQERKASALVVQLDRQLALEGTAAQTAAQTSAQQTGQVARPARGQAERWKEDEQQLLDIDVAINAGLKDVYTKAAAGKQPENDDLLVRTALLHWTVLLRRMSMQGFHTQVPGLEGDPDCAGDIIGDQLLLRYFVWEKTRRSRRAGCRQGTR